MTINNNLLKLPYIVYLLLLLLLLLHQSLIHCTANTLNTKRCYNDPQRVQTITVTTVLEDFTTIIVFIVSAFCFTRCQYFN